MQRRETERPGTPGHREWHCVDKGCRSGRSLSTRRVGTVHQSIVRWRLAVKDLQTDVALPVTQQAAHEIAHAEGTVDIADQLAEALFTLGPPNRPVARQLDQATRLARP